MKFDRKRVLHRVGSVLALLGGIFVVVRLRQYSAQADFASLHWRTWLAVGGLSLVYGVAGCGLAIAWRRILASLQAPVTAAWAVRTYGISQIAKYTPGNIFHLAGRQGLGMAANLPAWALAKSMVWEHGLLVVVAALCAWLVLPAVWPGVTPGCAFAGFAASAALVYLGLRRFANARLAGAFLWHVGFLLSAGVIFLLVVDSVSSKPVTSWGVCVGAYVLAWLAGLVTPGAPAGMGIREIVLLALLPASVVANDELLLAIVLGRVVTVLGDVWFYAAANVVRGN